MEVFMRNDTAGTTILYHLCIHRRTHTLIFDDYGPAGAAGAWALQQHPQEPWDLFRDYGQARAADAAAKFAGTA